MKNINVKLQCQEFGSYLVLVVLAHIFALHAQVHSDAGLGVELSCKESRQRANGKQLPSARVPACYAQMCPSTPGLLFLCKPSVFLSSPPGPLRSWKCCHY